MKYVTPLTMEPKVTNLIKTLVIDGGSYALIGLYKGRTVAPAVECLFEKTGVQSDIKNPINIQIIKEAVRNRVKFPMQSPPTH